MITRGQNSPSRLDVWDLDTRQHIIGWKPKFTGWPDSKNASDRQDPLARVRGIDKAVSADFVNSDHVLTVFNEATILWKLPELTAVYVLPLVRTSVLSPGRKYLLHGGDRSQSDIMAHHSLTGEPLGRLAVGGRVSGFSVSAAGDRIAVRGYQELIALDWKTGTVQTRFKLPFFTERLAWTDDRFLISSDGRVVDLQEQLIVWRYLTNGGAAAETVPDNRSWLAVSSGQNTGTVTVSAIRLPDQQVRNALADMDLKPKMLMEPGSVVSVEANVSGHPPGQSDYQAVVVEKVTKALTNAGHKVQNGGSFRAVISLTHKLTDEKMQFTTEALGRFGISRPNSGSVIEVPVERVSFGVKLLGAGGKELWSGSQGGTSNEVGRFAEFRLKKGESLQKILVRGMWSSVDSTLRSIAFPSRIFDPSMSSGFGTSMIVNGQPVIQSQ